MPGANRFVSAAIEERLDQLDLILDMIRERHRVFASSVPLDTPQISNEHGREILRLNQEIEMLHVAFYYFANAVTTIIEENPLPYLETFRANDVSFVRNRLLEHIRPDPDSPFARVSVLDPGGPRFTKPVRDMGMRSSGSLYDEADKFSKIAGDLFNRAVTAAERAKRETT